MFRSTIDFIHFVYKFGNGFCLLLFGCYNTQLVLRLLLLSVDRLNQYYVWIALWLIGVTCRTI